MYRRDRQLIRELPARSLLAATLHAASERSGADLAMDVIAAWRAIGEPDYLGMSDALVVGSELALLAGDVDEAEILAASAVGVTELPPPHLLNARRRSPWPRCTRPPGGVPKRKPVCDRYG